MVSERLRVYVWEFPIRSVHWIIMLCIITLSITGFYIGNPFIHAYSSKQYIMGWMRFVHFILAYVLMLSVIIRIYWGFMGNKYASFRSWLPFPLKQFRHLIESVKFYLFIKRRPSYLVGHSYLAGSAYLILYVLFIFEIISGFALYSVNHSGFIWTVLGGWLWSMMSLQTIRLLHHLVMYLILLIAVIHIYVAWYLDLWEKSGLLDSVFSGYKYVIKKSEDL